MQENICPHLLAHPLAHPTLFAIAAHSPSMPHVEEWATFLHTGSRVRARTRPTTAVKHTEPLPHSLTKTQSHSLTYMLSLSFLPASLPHAHTHTHTLSLSATTAPCTQIFESFEDVKNEISRRTVEITGANKVCCHPLLTHSLHSPTHLTQSTHPLTSHDLLIRARAGHLTPANHAAHLLATRGEPDHGGPPWPDQGPRGRPTGRH